MDPTPTTYSLGLKPGTTLTIKGIVPPFTKNFSFNIGMDFNNLALHFNPRLNHGPDVNTIVCNSRYRGIWGEEFRQHRFPFHKGQKVEVTVQYEMDQMKITLQDGHTFVFPNRLDMRTVNYLSVEGFDLHSHGVTQTQC
ncbi:hypothetical protein NDU88_001791 [Pleurodeles waltl]|uniref:Galectin n=1 Tax=Pleurodeles waltl TaxID=8319 RepID=A0AAV7S9Y9_PLEWA|nr:hypothetical protein NDU88_001791 [Pleurodeles waltl]